MAVEAMNLIPTTHGARQRLASVVERTLSYVKSNLRHQRSPLQHVLLAGPPGAGKTVALNLIADAIGELGQASLTVVRVNEIECSIIEPEALLRRAAAAFGGNQDSAPRYPWRGGNDSEWLEAQLAFDAAVFSQNNVKPLVVLLLDGLDLLLANGAADKAAQSRLRDVLQNHAHIMMIATACSTETQNDPEARIFHALAPIPLPAIDFNTMAAELDSEDARARAAAAAVAVIFRQTPEHIWSFARLTRLAAKLTPRQCYQSLVDIEQERLLRSLAMLALRPRRIADALLQGGEPARPTELAQRLETNSSNIGQALRELFSSGAVALHPESSIRHRLYYYRDRLVADCYRKACGLVTFDLSDAVAVLALHFMVAEGFKDEHVETANADADAVKQILEREGRGAAYAFAAKAIDRSKTVDHYIDALTFVLIRRPLIDEPFTEDLARLLDAKTQRRSHGTLITAAARDVREGLEFRLVHQPDVEAVVTQIRSEA